MCSDSNFDEQGYDSVPGGEKSQFEDIQLTCVDCGQLFTFTAGEQEFYASKGFQNQPKRCRTCRDARKGAQHETFRATCAECGGEAIVPFKPTNNRPVYCSECFAKLNPPRQSNQI